MVIFPYIFYKLVCTVGDNRMLRWNFDARYRAFAGSVHVRGPLTDACAPPRGFPHAVLCAHAAYAEAHGGAWRYITLFQTIYTNSYCNLNELLKRYSNFVKRYNNFVKRCSNFEKRNRNFVKGNTNVGNSDFMKRDVSV